MVVTLALIVLSLSCVCGDGLRYYGKTDVVQSSENKTEKKLGRWIYFGSHKNRELSDQDGAYLEESVKKWTEKQLTDDELAEWITQRMKKSNQNVQTVGVMSNQLCLFDGEMDVPDYEKRLAESDGIYEFVGLYTEDQVNEEGKLICYYWEAGAR